MKKETCNRTSRSGMPGDTCGTKSRNKNWLRGRRIEDSDDAETVEDGAYAGGSGDGPRGGPALRTGAKRVLRVHQCGEHWAGGRARVRSGREVRCGALPVHHSGTGGRRWKAGSAECLRDLSQHAVHHNAATAAGGNLGSRSKQNDEGVWRAHSGGGGQENHGLSPSPLRAGKSEGIG